MNVIEVQNLSKNFKIKKKRKGFKESFKYVLRPDFKIIKAVDNISFCVKKGEIIAFIGPNGAGKSTTIKLLISILYPDSGSIKVLGLDPIKNRKKLAYKIGTVFGQKEQLWAHLTPYDNFKFFAAIYDISNNEAEKRIKELTNLFEFERFINTPVKNLSLGQRICCEIAASIIHNPQILFLDEPTIGLDPIVKENIRKFIKNMNKEYQTTVFLTSHDVSDIEKLCKRIIIMNDSKIVIDSSMENLKYNYLTKKILEIKTNGSTIDISNIKGVNILKREKSIIKADIDISKKDISDVIKALDYKNIVDINITNIPLENIISKIYSSKAAKL